jgi:hypothetical protein
MRRVALALLMLCSVPLVAQDSTNVYPITVLYGSIQPINVGRTANVFKDVFTTFGANTTVFQVRFNSETVREMNLRVRFKTDASATYRIELRNADSSKVFPVTITGVVDTTLESGFISVTGAALDTFKLYAKASTATARIFIYRAELERRVRVVALANTNLIDSITNHQARIKALEDVDVALLQDGADKSDSLAAVYDSLKNHLDDITSGKDRDNLQSDSLKTAYTNRTSDLATIRNVEDSLKHAYDSLANHRTSITKQTDTSAVHRTAINAKVELSDSVNNYATQNDIRGVSNLSSTAIDWAIAPQFTDTLTAATTYTFSNIVAGKTIQVRLVTDDSRNVSVVWPLTVTWGDGGAPPTPFAPNSIYTVELRAVSTSMQLGRYTNRYNSTIVAAIADTVAPDSSLDVYARRVTPSVIEYSWMPPQSGDQGYEPVTYLFKLSAGKRIGYTTAAGTGGTTPAVTKLRSLQKGTWTIAAGGYNTTVTLPTAVTLAKSVVIVNTSSSNMQENFARVGYGLTGTTSLYIRRTSTTGSPAISGTWKVMEYETGATVEHGSFIFDNDSTVENISITSSNVDSTFLLFSYPNVNTTTTQASSFIRGEILDATHARFTTCGARGGSSTTVYYQIVKLDSTLVFKGDVSFSTSDTAKTGTPTSTAVGKGWLIYSYNGISNSSATDVGRAMIRGRHTAATTVTFDRDHSGSMGWTLSWFLVKFTGVDSVINGTSNFAADDTTNDETIATTSSMAFPWGTGIWGYGGRTVASTGGNLSNALFDISIVGDATLRATRRTADTTAQLSFQVVRLGRPGGSGSTIDTIAFDDAADANGVRSSLGQTTVAETYTVSGLTAGAFNSFAFKAIDSAGNVSGMSNRVDTTTLSNPVTVSGTYSVATTGSDDSLGTLAKPFRTFAKAASVAEKGDTIYIRNGSYSERLLPHSGAVNEPIYWIVYPGETVTLTSTTYGADVSGINYVVLDGFTFSGNSNAINSQNSTGIEVKNCVISAWTGWTGIGLSGSKWVISGCTFNPGAGTVSKDGIMTAWKTTSGVGSDYNLIEGNTFTNFTHSPINLKNGANHTIVTGNTFYGNHHSIDGVGGNWLPTYNVIERNTIYNYGVWGGGGHAIQGVSSGDIVRFNFSYDDTNNITGADQYEHVSVENFGGSGISGVKIYHNTFLGYTKSPRWKATLLFSSLVGGEVKLNDVYNNVFELTDRYAARERNVTPSNRYAGNILRIPSDGTSPIRYEVAGGAATSYTLANAKTAYPNLWVASNVMATSLAYADSANRDMNLTSGSQAHDAGVALTTATNAGTSSNTLTVADAGWFCDGYGLQSGDLIRIGTTTAVRVVSVNLTSRTLQLSSARTWSIGDGVFVDYKGTAPDAGAYEYNE